MESSRPLSVLDRTLAELDPDVAGLVDAELARQRGTLEMIASENLAPLAVMQAQGSVLTNKYAEGYPGRRADIIAETLQPPLDEERAGKLRGRVASLADRFPLYPTIPGMAR